MNVAETEPSCTPDEPVMLAEDQQNVAELRK